jgi:hypothetical protein
MALGLGVLGAGLRPRTARAQTPVVTTEATLDSTTASPSELA